MSTSNVMMADYCRILTRHEGREAVIDRFKNSMFRQWIIADDDRRKEIADIMMGADLFLAEIDKVLAESADLTGDENG